MSTGRRPADASAILRAAEAAARSRRAARPSRPSSRAGVLPSSGEDADEGVRKALAFILRTTNARPQTEAEVRAKLADRDVDEGTAERAIAGARELGALDDRAFATAWVAERGAGKGYGGSRLRDELRRRRVPEPLIDEALGQLDGRDDHAAATELARRRLRLLPTDLAPEAVVRRLTAYLVRRGHGPALAQRVAILVSGVDRDWD